MNLLRVAEYEELFFKGSLSPAKASFALTNDFDSCSDYDDLLENKSFVYFSLV
jgi:hypothetical protein